MTNIRVSPLLLYVKTQLAFRTPKNITLGSLFKAQEVLNDRIVNCCLYHRPVKNDYFLNTFYVLLNNMDSRMDIPKLLEVKKYLDFRIACCALAIQDEQGFNIQDENGNILIQD